MNHSHWTLRRVLGVALLTVAYFWIAPVVWRYSNIWDLQANPRPNVEVKLKSGKWVKGDYARTWDGDMSIREADGTKYFFRDFVEMSSPMPPLEEREEAVAKSWRAWAGPTALTAICICALLVMGWPRARDREVLS